MIMGRRHFVRSTLATAAAAALPARSLWADSAAATPSPGLAALTGDGRTISLAATDIQDLRRSLHGQLLLAGDAGYDTVRRVWNPMFDKHPALIARCAGAADVAQAVKFAHAHGLLTAVRAGGHSLSGQSVCEGGLMIDLQPMKGIQVDTQRLVGRAQGGVLLGELDRSMQAVGLATTLGTATDTGIAGLTLGGGLGRLMRKYGLSCDNLQSVDVVTADGSLLHASDTENAELFWGVRGGGGNFGVVTTFEYRLHPLAHKVLTGQRTYPYGKARSVFAAVTELAHKAPDEMALAFSLANSPSGPAAGRSVRVGVEYNGEPAEGEKILAVLDSLGTPLTNHFTAVTYLHAQGAEGAATMAAPNAAAALGGYEKSGFLRTADEKFFDELLRHFDALPAALESEVEISLMGGAVGRVDPKATAYWNRRAEFILLVGGSWGDRSLDEANIKALREAWAGVEKFTEGYYINADPNTSNARLRATYGDNYARLAALKTKYDPDNLFRLNANIAPAVI